MRVTGWLCLAENMPSGTAIRPNDVLRIRGGTTVEVLNTDAEGRLVLADGLAAASEEQPDAIVDVATLTGAQVVALGHRIAGADGRRRSWSSASSRGRGRRRRDRVADAAPRASCEPLLDSRMSPTSPTPSSGIPCRRHAARRRASCASSSARRRRTRTSAIPWAHLDIAGPANNAGGGWGFTGKGPTGVAVRTLSRWPRTSPQR